MRVIFFGTGPFGLPTLKKLLKSGHEVAAVVTQPDRKKGRGWNVRFTPVKAFMEQSAPGIDVFQPENVSDPAFIDSLRELGADVFVVIDYGQLLKKDLLEAPRKYCVNLHPSLLPVYRGAAPVNWAILNGDKETGNTVIRMNERMDAGSVIAQKRTEIGEDEDADALADRLSRSGADLMMNTLELIEGGNESFQEQNEGEATYARKLEKKQGEIDWQRPAVEIVRKVRAMQPWPGAFTFHEGKRLRILSAREADIEDKSCMPGTVRDPNKLIVAAGEGAVRMIKLQLEGKKAMSADEFLHGHRLEKGTFLGK